MITLGNMHACSTWSIGTHFDEIKRKKWSETEAGCICHHNQCLAPNATRSIGVITGLISYQNIFLHRHQQIIEERDIHFNNKSVSLNALCKVRCLRSPDSFLVFCNYKLIVTIDICILPESSHVNELELSKPGQNRYLLTTFLSWRTNWWG